MGLIIGFSIRMHKRVADAQNGITPDLEVPANKSFRLSRSDEEVQATPVVIVVDSPEQVLEAPSTVRDAA